ncbi:uncharacterized protein LOC127112805 [Lathyrus oleraceus]|uniref:uncharacterized protein LOC127112805 n=1 Tax=Pisum sativum TaxID=3888 RepID=UPI0021CF6B02|nr:uncharacterized protein LOC127112805 [Pisum sativum]
MANENTTPTQFLANLPVFKVSIKESKNPTEMKLEEIQPSLKAYEIRLKQRSSERDKVAEKALQARFIKKFGKEKGKNIPNDEKSIKNSKNHSDPIKKGMVNTYFGKKVDMKEVQWQINMWYLDSGCSNHMTRNKDWFTMLDESVEKVIKFADGNSITSNGKGDISIVIRDGRKSSVTDVLYVPSITSNFISIGQLLVKGYNMKI